MKAIIVRQTGGPDALSFEELPDPKPTAGQALVRLKAIGINFIDVYFRTGLYKADLPLVPGMEGAGEVESVGPDVTDIVVGDRVAWAMTRGSYAEFAVVPSSQLIRIPEGLDYRTAAALMLQGMTAHYLTRSTFPLKSGDTALLHAAAGGAGLLISQLAKSVGARVIGTVSTEEKAHVARIHGVDHTILYTKQDFETEARRLTGGRGADVVYDSVGATTFAKSLNSLRPRGMLVLFGQSSGPVSAFDPAILNQKGSIFLTRPSLAHYLATREELLWRANDVLSAAASGQLKVLIGATYPLRDAARAHSDLESRRTMGKLLLIPE